MFSPVEGSNRLDRRRLAEAEVERDHYRAMLEELIRAIRADEPIGALRRIISDALD
jgi:hypothetical protein